MANNSKTEHVLYGTLFVVQMYRWGNLEEHNYTAGVFDNEQDAKLCGIAENLYRADKYNPVIYKHKLNEWRNGNYQDMVKELKDYNLNIDDIEEQYDKVEAYEMKLKKEDKEAFVELQVEKWKKKYGKEDE